MFQQTTIKGILGKYLPFSVWLPAYKKSFIRWDLIAGITLVSFVLPESMAYATLAGVPTYFGIYCCLAGGLFFALFSTSKQVAVGPTSSISLMIGSTVAVLSKGDPTRWAEIAGLTALAVAMFCLLAYVFRLSMVVDFISDSILFGFKAGAALSIMSTQLPKLFGVAGGGSDFFNRIYTLFKNIPDTNTAILIFGLAALTILILGDIFLKGKPISLVVVIVSILVMYSSRLSSVGIHTTGVIPSGLPDITVPSLRFHDVDGVLELAFACFLMGYIETISAARTFALKNGYTINARQELLSLGASNLATAFLSGYVVSGGLSQSTVNDNSGAKTPMSLIICSAALSLILLFFTGLLKNLPEVILAAIVIHAVSGLIKINELKRIRKLNPEEFMVALFAIVGVLVFGILKGVMISVVMSLILLIRRTARPDVAVLGRIGNTSHFSDKARHPDNLLVPGIVILRIESSILYFNSADILEKIKNHIASSQSSVKYLILDLSASTYVDVSGSKMLLTLANELKKQGIGFRIVQALSGIRDILRKQGMEEIIGHIDRHTTIDEAIAEFNSGTRSLADIKKQ